MCYLGEVVAEWLASQTRNPKVVGSNLRSSRDCRWGEWMYSALFTLNTTTEVPLSKAPNLQLLPGRRSINDCPLLRVCVHGVCVFTAVCVHLGWVKCRARIPSMGHHSWLYVTSLHFTSLHFTSLHFTSLFLCNCCKFLLSIFKWKLFQQFFPSVFAKQTETQVEMKMQMKKILHD